MRRCYYVIFAIVTILLGGAACGRMFFIADHPFVLAEEPPGMPRLPLRVAILRTPAMRKIPTKIGQDELYGERLAIALMQGLRDAGSLVVKEIWVAETMPQTDVDLICLPTNPYFDAQWDERKHLRVTMTLEVTVIESRTGAQRGLLLQAEGTPGRRPALPVHISDPDTSETWNAGVTGAWVQSSRFDQAVNNALFYLSLDFAEKLQKRGAQYLRETREGSPN